MTPPADTDKTLTQAPRQQQDETLSQSAESVRRSAELSANDPRRVPGYDLFDEVGRGGMGIVYRAFDKSMSREVAVKVLSEKYDAGSSHALRFVEEAKITGQLQHPGIPAVYHVGRLENGRPFLAMKLIKGHTLDDLLKQNATIDTLAIFESISQAVGYAHSHGVIHRDLKPANIMVGAFGEVQVMDWGLAKVMAKRETSDDASQTTQIHSPRDSDASFTQAGSIMGTPAFMSPEQAAGETDRVDARADVFGLGAILCVMLTGKPLYEGTSADSVLFNAVGGKTDAALARLDACAAEPDVVDLCKRCLSVDPTHRPANVEKLAEEIGNLRRASEDRARNAELARHAADVRTAEQLKRRRVWLALAALLVIGTATSIVLAIQSYRARKDAEKAHKETQKQKTLAERQLTRAEWLVYANSIDDAQRHLRDGRPGMAKDELNSCRIDFRGWEHDYLFSRSVDQRTTRLDCSDKIGALVISRDGKRIVAASDNRTVQVWDAESLRLVTELKGHTKPVLGVAIDPNRGWIASGAEDATIRIWDANSFQSRHVLIGHTGAVKCLAVFPTGPHLLSASADRTVRIWDTNTFQCVATLKGHDDTVECAAIDPKGTHFVTGSTDRTVRVWDASTHQPLATLTGHSSRVTCVTISPNGQWILSGSDDRTLRVWDAKTFRLLAEMKGHSDAVRWVAVSSDHKRIASASADQEIWLWETEHWTSMAALKGHSGEVNALCYSPDGKTLISTSNDRTIHFWRVLVSQPETELEGCTTARAIAFSPDGALIWAKDENGTSYAWVAATGQPATGDEPIPDIPDSKESWSPDRKFSVRIVEGHVQLRDEAKWAKVAEVKQPPHP